MSNHHHLVVFKSKVMCLGSSVDHLGMILAG